MRRGLWWTVGGLGALALYAGVRVFTTYWDFGRVSAELPEAVREYRAAGLPWTAADIDRHVPARDNAAPLVRRAIAAMPSERADRAFDANPAAVGPYLPALRLFHEVAKRPDLDLGRDWDLGPNLLFPEPAAFKRIAKVLAARAETRAARGDDTGALTDLEDARRLATLVGKSPSIIESLVSAASHRIADAGAQRCLARVYDRPERLARYRRWLTASAPLPSFNAALRGEVYLILANARNLDRQGVGRGLLPTSDINPFIPDDTPEVMAGHYPPVAVPIMRRDGLPENVRSRAYVARFLQMWTELARDTHGLTDPPEVIGRRASAIQDRYVEAKGLSHQLDAILFPVFAQAGRTSRLAEAARAVNLAYADALILHARTGRWPSATDIRDPLGRRPLRVCFDGGRFRVWSVGQNGKDDGGRSPWESKGADDEAAAYPPIKGPPFRP